MYREHYKYISLVDDFHQLLMLEAQHGTPSQYTPAVSQLIDYYKKVIGRATHCVLLACHFRYNGLQNHKTLKSKN